MVVTRAILVLTMRLEILATIVVTIAPMLLWAELVHLLWAGSKLVRTIITSSCHYSILSTLIQITGVDETYFGQEAVGYKSVQHFHTVNPGSCQDSYRTLAVLVGVLAENLASS